MSHLTLPVQRPARNSEQTSRPALVSARQPQHSLDVPVLEGAQIRDLVLSESRGRLGEPEPRLRQPLEVLAPDRAALREGGRSLEEVLELANVAREVVAEDRRVRVAVEVRRVPAFPRREPLEEVADEARDVFASVPQGRQSRSEEHTSEL